MTTKIRQIPAERLDWNASEPEARRPRPFARLLVGLLAFVTISLTAATAPQDVQAYEWGPWHVKYVSASSAECRKSRDAANRFIGPIQYYSDQCAYRIRWRKAVINGAAAWTDQWVEVENSAPFWSAWGMKMRVLVQMNGDVARHDPASKQCFTWSFLVKVTETECKVWNNNTDHMFLRIGYDCSFLLKEVGFSFPRGARQDITPDGMGNLTKWP